MPRYDLHIQLLDPSIQRTGSNFSVLLSAPIFVTGFQTLINRWLKLFMTPKNSDPIYPLRGTEFSYLIGTNVVDLNVLEEKINEYIADATEQIRSIDQDNLDLPANQRLQDATFLRFNVIPPNGIEFWVSLTNLAQQRLEVLIPYRLNNG